MEEFSVIVVEGNPPEQSPIPAIERIWSRTAAVLRHYAWFNTDEFRVQAFQHGILATGDLLSPSLFGDGTDRCRGSFAFRHLVFFRFAEGPEEYFWITAQLDRCYALGALYLPAHRLALTLYPFTVSAELLAAFEQFRASAHRRAPRPGATGGTPVVVSGFFHIIHHLWNELPAIERAVDAGLAGQMRVACLYQPLGPLDQLFPELAGRVEALTEAGLAAKHASVEMFTALGAWTIPHTTQARVLQVADRHAGREARAERERFRQRHWPIVWLSVKPPQRTCSDQAAVMAAVMQGIQARYPHAGFLLNGVSYPWDLGSNANYLVWLKDMLEKASAKTAEIIDATMARLAGGLRDRTRILSRLPVTEEICWAAMVDFYVCHGGTMQNKLGWLRAVPGVIHSNTKFLAEAPPVPPVSYGRQVEYRVPDSLIIDVDAANYTPDELARRDQNYSFKSIGAFVDFVVATLGSLDLQPGPGWSDAVPAGPQGSMTADAAPDGAGSRLGYHRTFRQGDAFAHRGSYYTDFMALLDRHLRPGGYFEIGTDTGTSLNCFSCDAVCVDPEFRITGPVWQGRRRTLLFQCTSDDFFGRERLDALLPDGLDIAFLDGMHRAEYLLRDFMNTERMAHRRTLVLVHDCLPLNARMAERVARFGDESEGAYRDAWTGDVWRVLFALKRRRPELVVRYLDCPPTGLVAISNLHPGSAVLMEEYDAIVAEMMSLEFTPDRLEELWALYPIVDTAALAANPADITSVLNCH